MVQSQRKIRNTRNTGLLVLEMSISANIHVCSSVHARDSQPVHAKGQVKARCTSKEKGDEATMCAML